MNNIPETKNDIPAERNIRLKKQSVQYSKADAVKKKEESNLLPPHCSRLFLPFTDAGYLSS